MASNCMGLIDGFEHIVRDNEPLAHYTWFRLGGEAEYFAEPTTVEELAGVVKRFREADQPIRLIGGGSNLLIRDKGVKGLVIHLSAPAFGGISVEENVVKAGSGAKLGHVVSTAVREGLAGLESLVGIPGTIGGSLHTNATTHGGDIGQWTRAARVMTRSGEILSRTRDELSFAYRESCLDDLVFLDADFELEREDPAELTKRLQKTWIVKKSSQPANQNMGCIFKDAGGIAAGGLIEQAGLKGMRVGEAEVSGQNPNFVVTDTGATSEDVLQLVELMQSQVSDRLGVDLERQIEIW
jgi:UDP-N-acetylmuramate dehydrogenase